MGLYQKYRPQTLSEIKGNRNLISTLTGLFKEPEKLPHVFLFVGPHGCGKTSIARIIAEELNCTPQNLIEIDTAQFTGIDTVRDIRKSAQFIPLGGGNRVFIIDECFSKGTEIETPSGKVKIEDIKIGDTISSLTGNDKVLSIFENKVDLNRVMFLKFSNGVSIFCSKDHLFFTKEGWVKACFLNKNSLLVQGIFNTNDFEKSNTKSNNCTKNKGYKKNKWYFKCLERCSWWKWTIYTASNFISHCLGMANGVTNKNRKQTKRWFWLSYLLQSRYRQRKIEDSNRNRWKWTQIERKYIKRFEKDKETEYVKLESSAIYKQGSNDESFKSVITDKERNQGFVNFYDLEIQKHPSYFANGMAVHNCHKMTTDAQNAFLKILEDTPPHIYFILCTTNENSLLNTIKSRCSRFEVSLLTEREMSTLITEIAGKEGEELNEEIVEQIVLNGHGHPRDTINILEQVLATPEKRRLNAARKSQILQTEGIELCRALLKGSNWNTIKVILKGLKEQEPEGIRRIILGYMSSVLLNKDDEQAGLILECFEEPLYNTGFPGLVLACYKVVKG